MSNYEGFQAKLLQLGQDPSTDTELFARLFIAYKEHESVKEVTADLTKMMIKEEQTVDQEPQTPTSGLVLKDNENQSPATPGVTIYKPTGKYRAQRWDKETKKMVHIGYFGTEEEAVQALAVFDADGTKPHNEKQSPATPGVTINPTGKYRAQRWDKETKKFVHLGIFGTEEEAVQAVAAYDADGTKPQINQYGSSKYKGVSFNKERNNWKATREGGHLAEKKHIGTFNTEDEVGKAVKESGSFKEFYDEHYPDL